MDNLWLGVGYVIFVGIALGIWASVAKTGLVWWIVLILAAVGLLAILGYPIIFK